MKVDDRKQMVRIRSLLYQVHLGHQTQVVRLDNICLYTLSHPISPYKKLQLSKYIVLSSYPLVCFSSGKHDLYAKRRKIFHLK